MARTKKVDDENKEVVAETVEAAEVAEVAEVAETAPETVEPTPEVVEEPAKVEEPTPEVVAEPVVEPEPAPEVPEIVEELVKEKSAKKPAKKSKSSAKQLVASKPEPEAVEDCKAFVVNNIPAYMAPNTNTQFGHISGVFVADGNTFEVNSINFSHGFTVVPGVGSHVGVYVRTSDLK